MSGEIGDAGQPWTDFEIEVTVAAYVDMLRSEQRGERYSKAETVRRLQAILPTRTTGSIERKLQNVSAVLDEEGLPWIEGYKPLAHYQHDLQSAVLAVAGPGHQVGESLAAYGDSALVAAQRHQRATDDVLVPPPGGRGPARGGSTVGLTGGPLAALQDFKKHRLGAAGEEWVLDLERERLSRHGRDDLASSVTWVSREVGDGAGYDIGSFWPDGRERLIEVTTTNLGARTPFYITRWEIEVSRRRSDAYSLYRVHGFARDPRIYVLDGSVEERARLEPRVFLGLPL